MSRSFPPSTFCFSQSAEERTNSFLFRRDDKKWPFLFLKNKTSMIGFSTEWEKRRPAQAYKPTEIEWL